ncbi:cytochrome P450 like protein [Scytonema sp. HK-05]|nr:cytochrome P450 like protein [Scytonema sp. HK-05]
MNSQHKNTAAKAKQPTYDLFAPSALVNSYPLFKRMREEDPVHYSESFGYWVLTRYRDVEAALRDERLSSNRTALYINQLGNLDLILPTAKSRGILEESTNELSMVLSKTP